jgi:hypothetical protein
MWNLITLDGYFEGTPAFHWLPDSSLPERTDRMNPSSQGRLTTGYSGASRRRDAGR